MQFRIHFEKKTSIYAVWKQANVQAFCNTEFLNDD